MNSNPYAPPGAPVADPALSGASYESLSLAQLPEPDRRAFVWGFIGRLLAITLLSAGVGSLINWTVLLVFGLLAHSAAGQVIVLASSLLGLNFIVASIVGFVLIGAFWRWLFRGQWSGYRLRLVR